MQIAAVILNFNGAKTTIECLESLARLRLAHDIELKIIVVDNGSSDDSVRKIRSKQPDTILIENKENLGYTGGCNEGARYAISNDADFVMFLNNDTIVHEDLISELVLPFSSETVGAAVPKIYFEKGFEFHKGRYSRENLGKVIWYAGGQMDWSNLIGKNIGVDEVDRGQYDIRMETDLATGCCFLIRSGVLKKIGLFDDKYFLYYEDADLSERIKRAGFKIIYEPKAVLWHKNAESSGGSGSDLQDYYITRNRLLFGMKYASVRTKAALIRESIQLLRSGRLWQKKGIRDYFLRNFGIGSFKIR